MTDAELPAAAVAKARAAAKLWAACPIDARVRRISLLRSRLMDAQSLIIDTLVSCTGKPRTEALLGELWPILDLLVYYEKHAAQILSPRDFHTSPLAYPGASASTYYKPFGVVLVIAPWNYPLQLALIPMLSALIAGNAVILKPSEYSGDSGELVVRLMNSCDLPEHLVQCVHGNGVTGNALINAHPDLVFFTGSHASGRKVMQAAAQHPIPVMLELGGKDPMIIFADAPWERTIAGAVYGAFSNSGQICVSVERCYVEATCHDAFVTDVIAATERLTQQQDEESDLGPMIHEAQADWVEALYNDAVAQGAKASRPFERKGAFIRPIVLTEVNHTMRVMQEECFGPLLPVMRFETEAEVIRWANASRYGLNASIWSTDLEKAERVGYQLETGNWVVNDVIKNIGNPALPFGGVKQSGFGRYHGAAGLLAFSQSISRMVTHNYRVHEPNWFPYTEENFVHLRGFVDFMFGQGSLIQRYQRNAAALKAFRRYAAFDFKQHWNNLRLAVTAPWNRRS